jgi:hypothetical protein
MPQNHEEEKGTNSVGYGGLLSYRARYPPCTIDLVPHATWRAARGREFSRPMPVRLFPPPRWGRARVIGARISRSSQAEDWMPAYASMTKGTSFPRKRASRRRFLATHWLSEPLNLAPMRARVGVKAGGVRMPRSPPSQPFPATASAEGAQFNGRPSPTRGEGAKNPERRGDNRELNGPGGLPAVIDNRHTVCRAFHYIF